MSPGEASDLLDYCHCISRASTCSVFLKCTTTDVLSRKSPIFTDRFRGTPYNNPIRAKFPPLFFPSSIPVQIFIPNLLLSHAECRPLLVRSRGAQCSLSGPIETRPRRRCDVSRRAHLTGPAAPKGLGSPSAVSTSRYLVTVHSPVSALRYSTIHLFDMAPDLPARLRPPPGI